MKRCSQESIFYTTMLGCPILEYGNLIWGPIARLVPNMLLKLLIMRFGAMLQNFVYCAQFICSTCKALWCTNSTFYFSYLTKLWVLAVFLVPLQSSTLLTIHSSTYVYEHYEFIFVTFTTLVNSYILWQIIATDSCKTHNPVHV